VIERTKIKDKQEIEEAQFGQQVKQKPMNQIRKEVKERAYLLERAIKDKEKLLLFTRLVDYMTVETLVSTNFYSMNILMEEMRKEKKNGLFNTTVMFDEEMVYTPDETEIKESIFALLEEMIETVRTVSRVITRLENYVKSPPVERIFDIKDIIENSEEFSDLKFEISSKVKSDFELAKKYVNQNFEKCRPIHVFMNEWNLEAFMSQEQKLEVIKAHIYELKKWSEELSTNIKDTPKGILNIDGKKIKGRLYPYV